MPRAVDGYTLDQAKAGVLDAIAKGLSVEEACKKVSRSRKSYENWRSADPDWARKVDSARARRARARERGKDPELYNLGFAEWRKRFLRQDTYPHQQMWIDVLEGRDPDVWHPAITYRKKDPRRILVNTPPYHGKSQTITQEYVTYYLCMNPARRVVIISETSEAAKKFLYSIQTMLTSPDFVELQEAYAPEGGFKPARGEGRWGSNQIYLAGRAEGAVDQAAKDPSVQIVGVGGQIYGSRADLIVLDDAVSDKNVAGYEKQFGWLTRTVLSRAKSGKVLVVGTRVAPIDLYATMLNGDNYTTGESPWTYVAQPAVLEYGDTPAEWRTLWPRSSRPMDEVLEQEPGEDGLYQCWDGEELARVRADNPPGVWALVYQQQQVDDDMTFSSMCVWGSVDRRRKPGPLKAGAWGHPYNGLEGMRNILSIDPAGTGEAFMLAYSVDRVKGQRWVQNAWTSNHTKPSWYADMIEKICPEYEIHDVVIESNAYASWLIHDERIVNYCRQRGIRISGHYTSKNKTDPDFGVASMSSLFGSVARRDDGRGNETGAEHHKGDNIIFLPDPDKSAGVKALIDQLITWVPGRRGGHLRQDGPMALDVDTPLWTSDGWTTVGDVRIGQEVATPAGSLTTVVAKTDVVTAEPYRVTLEDGSSLVADGAHRWWVSAFSGSNLSFTGWMTTDEIRAWGRGRVMLDRPKPVEMPGFDSYPIDPYVLGAWLGDGTSAQASIVAADADRGEMRGLIESCGYETTDQRGIQFGVGGLYPHLRAEGLLCNKHIPQAYLHGSMKQRLALLQGLMDTDGTVMNKAGRVYFGNTNKDLVDGVAFLARSLGYRADVQFYPRGVQSVMGRRCETQDFWRVIFTASPDLNPFRLERKARKVREHGRSNTRRRLSIRSIEPVSQRQVQCLTVADGSHQFLAGAELVPTGNCLWFAELRARTYLQGGDKPPQTHVKNRFLSPRAARQRIVVPMHMGV